MKKKILLNLSCLCVLFGGSSITECGAMKSNKTADLSTLRSLKRMELPTILKVCNFNADSGSFDLKEDFRKKGDVFTNAVLLIQSEYKNNPQFRESFDDAIKKKNKDTQYGETGFEAIKDTIKINDTEVAISKLESEKYSEAEFKDQAELQAAQEVINKLIKETNTYTKACIDTLEKCKNNLPGVEKKEDEKKYGTTEFEAIKDTIKINDTEVAISKLESEKYSEAEFKDQAELQAAQEVINGLIAKTNIYSKECIDTLQKCKNNLPEVKKKEEEKKDAIIDVEKIIKSYNIQVEEQNLNAYDTQATQQAAAYLLKERYKKKSSIRKEDEDLVILLTAIAKEKESLYVLNKDNTKHMTKNQLVNMIYGAKEEKAFGIEDAKLSMDTNIQIQDSNTLFPEAVMKQLNIEGKSNEVCDHMLKIYKEKHLALFGLTDAAKKAIENAKTLEEKLKALGLSDEASE